MRVPRIPAPPNITRCEGLSQTASDCLLDSSEGQTEKTSDPSAYLLTNDQMTEHAYPVPSALPDSPLNALNFEDWKRSDGWIEAPFVKASGGQRKVLGLDCEMVCSPTQILFFRP